MEFSIIISYLIFALMIFAPIGILLFILANKKLGKPSDRLFYLAFWLFFWFVLTFPNYYLSFLIVGDNCFDDNGKTHCGMPTAQLTLGIMMAMVESVGLLWWYHKSQRLKKSQEMSDITHEDGVKPAVLWGIGLIILVLFVMFIAKSLGL